MTHLLGAFEILTHELLSRPPALAPGSPGRQPPAAAPLRGSLVLPAASPDVLGDVGHAAPGATAGPTGRGAGLATALRHGFTTHKGAAGQALALGRDFAALAGAAGFSRGLTLTQVHGAVVVRAEAAQAGAEADAVIAQEPGVLLGIQTADCVPLLFHDARHGAVGAAHAGWRGTAARIAEATLRAMTEAYGTRPADVTAVIGPAIGPCCFEVGDEVLAGLESATPGAGQPAGRTLRGRPTANLWRANRLQLERAGVPAAQVGLVNVCTHCRADLFPSYRRDGQGCGRIYSFIGLRGPHLLG